MYQIVYYVPASHLEATKSAVFSAGAGGIGNYRSCCWQILGQGQFQPNAAAKPFIGEANQLEQVDEYRVELVCDDAYIREAILALRAAHPYEEPAISCWRLEDL